jgi:hypothetical protein
MFHIAKAKQIKSPNSLCFGAGAVANQMFIAPGMLSIWSLATLIFAVGALRISLRETVKFSWR